MTEDLHRPLAIRGGLVLDATGFLGPADLLVQHGNIAAIGAPGMPIPDHAQVIDASRRLLHPGLVNAHTHGHGNLSRSMGDRITLELLLASAPHTSPYRSTEEKRVSATIGAAEMLLKGCTACYDLFVEFPLPTEEGIASVAEAYTQAGMRAVIAPMMADMTLYEAIPGLMDALPPHLQKAVAPLGLPSWQETLERMRAILHNWRADRSLVRPAVAPTIPLHCRDEFMIACRDLASEYDVGIHTHLAESKVQSVVGMRRYGRSLTAHIEHLGLLSPRFVAAHGVWLDADEMKRIGAHGGSVAHNAASNMRLGNGIADAAGMLAVGVNLGIGTDAATCNDNLNMFEAMHFAAAASHSRGPDTAQWITTPQVFAAATTGSARALGFDNIGRIAPGYAADIVFHNLDAPTLIPLNAPTTQMVLGEDGTSVEDVMVNGRFVVRNRKLLTVDLPALAARAAELRAEMDARAVASRHRYDAVAPIINDFCPALAHTDWHINRWCGC
ncbi:MAG TPA: amidohydrolase family protein [Acetobacteraceae bacterium]|nr:amidohydrolase family protein [Acetobacteraceae bacterium]